MAKAIMIQGTMSNAGKSLLCAGLCRILKQDGYKVAPFKSQNMALNSYITDDGLEIGRAQAMQAEAAGIAPSVYMNPILLKPVTNMGSQVIVNGKSIGNMKATEYYQMKHTLVPDIMSAYNRLASENDIIVIEGAGSPAEINLKDGDFVNMGMAKLANAPVLLAGDIDRGGVFAQIYGTIKLLDEDEQDFIKGVIINKFRGDVSLLSDGVSQIEKLTDKPVLGIVPMLDVDIDDEDSLSNRLNLKSSNGLIDIAVIRLGKISNFTDMAPLEATENVSVRYVNSVKELGNPDMIIIPGTKNTIDDLLKLRESGLEAQIKKKANLGTLIIGICGGYQMLGETISDDNMSENTEVKSIAGMGLLPIDTLFENEKYTQKTSGKIINIDGPLSLLSGMTVEGYELHMGKTKIREGSDACPIICTDNGSNDGCIKDNILGTYIHGFFDSDELRNALLQKLASDKGIDLTSDISRKEYKEMQYDKLAEGVRNSLDMERIYKILGISKDSCCQESDMSRVNDSTEHITTDSEFLPSILPMDIEKKSFEIIESELPCTLDDKLSPIIKRVIHTTADFDYIENLFFSKDVYEKAIDILKNGATIITDTNMAKSGINKSALKKLGCNVMCFMSDEDVAKKAKNRGTTRATIAIKKAAALEKETGPQIFAIGNAPTALIELEKLMAENKIHPALIIGVPVGFVNVVYAKELIINSGIDCIVARGRKGGSNVAAAIVNALMYLCVNRDEL